jgi:hypothetical protein
MTSAWYPRVLDPAFRQSLVESYFVKLNHPEQGWAAWVKYTFLRAADPAHDRAATWFTFFDPQARLGGELLQLKRSIPLKQCTVAGRPFEVRMGKSVLMEGRADGTISGGPTWRIRFDPGDRPFFLLPQPFYSPRVPATKLTTPVPHATALGEIRLGRERLLFDSAELSLGHNWGARHADAYVWGQARVALDSGDALFFEGFSLPLPTRRLASLPLVGRMLSAPRCLTAGKCLLHGPRPGAGGGRSEPTVLDLSLPDAWLLSSATIQEGRWEFRMESALWRLDGRLCWDQKLVARLVYEQPDGPVRTCRNSMLADAELTLSRRTVGGGWARVGKGETKGTAALEFLGE